MEVGNSGHCIDLEVLVGSETGSLLDWSPVGERGLRIIEPLIAEVLDVSGVNVRNTLSNLRASHAATRLDHLLANFLVGLHRGFLGHELVPVGVSAADDLDLVDKLTVEDGSCDANPVHLADEDFVSEEIAAPDTAVRVSKVLAGLLSHIGKFTKNTMSRVVLLLGVVKVLSVLLDIVVADHVLQELEGVVVLVVDGWGIEEDTNVGVVHLVVTHHEERWRVNALFRVLRDLAGLLLDVAEGSVNLLDEGVMLNTASADDYDVLTGVVG
jgi:hypothetical protein